MVAMLKTAWIFISELVLFSVTPQPEMRPIPVRVKRQPVHPPFGE